MRPYDKKASVIELEKLLDENDVESITRSIDQSNHRVNLNPIDET